MNRGYLTILYQRKNQAWRLWCAWSKNELAKAYPDTGGTELFVHNWYVCNGDPKVSADAQAVIDRIWARWRALDDRYKRLYDAAEHRQHIRANENGQYLWCEPCKVWEALQTNPHIG